MRINDPALKENLVKSISDSHLRRILSATIPKAKSSTELSAELRIPVRSLYRYIKDLSELGLLTVERSSFPHGGGKYDLYRSMVRSVTVKYEGNSVEIDLLPNEGILERFMRFWTYMGR
jgi:transcription initiation factor IIE alpha subunit